MPAIEREHDASRGILLPGPFYCPASICSCQWPQAIVYSPSWKSESSERISNGLHPSPQTTQKVFQRVSKRKNGVFHSRYRVAKRSELFNEWTGNALGVVALAHHGDADQNCEEGGEALLAVDDEQSGDLLLGIRANLAVSVVGTIGPEQQIPTGKPLYMESNRS